MWELLLCPDELLLRKRTRENWRTIWKRYQTNCFEKVKGGERVHSVRGPLRIETNACEADSTFILRHFSEESEFEVEK